LWGRTLVTLLGKNIPVPGDYAPQVLDPIPRAAARRALGLEGDTLPFAGEDLWHAWELSWVGPKGIPRVGVGRFAIPFDSPNLVESKSLKLYLNSLNNRRFGSAGELTALVGKDLSEAAGKEVGVEVLALDDPALLPRPVAGECIDGLTADIAGRAPAADMLKPVAGEGEQVLVSHLLRSLCPVTAQPDWASVRVVCAGVHLAPESLLAYLLSFRRHREFHEHCVERIWLDIRNACSPARLSVQAFYTRRGGLDINPYRGSGREPAPRLRVHRQ